MASKGFCMFFDWVDALNELDPADAWTVVQAVSDYYTSGKDPVEVVPKHLRAIVKVMLQQIKRSEKVSEVRAEAARAKHEKRVADDNDDLQNFAEQKSTKGLQKSATETDTETDTDTNTKTDTSFTSPCGDDKKRARKNAKKFVPPTATEVYLYCRERGNSVDANAFWEYYDAGGWKDAKGQPVRNWKQKVITWEKYDMPKEKPPDKPSSFDTDEFMLDALKRTHGEAAG